jgi:hypothetical protein
MLENHGSRQVLARAERPRRNATIGSTFVGGMCWHVIRLLSATRQRLMVPTRFKFFIGVTNDHLRRDMFQFRFWHLADINPNADTCPLLGVKRTSP